jgi:hypothetical protein
MKVRLTVERDGTPLFSTIFEVMNGDITVGTPAALNVVSPSVVRIKFDTAD